MRYHANFLAPIPGLDGYFATRSGKILSTRFGKVKALKPHINHKGYQQVALCNGKRQKSIVVHKLVLEAFDRGRREGEVCMHLNNNPADNRPCNLRWGTAKENTAQMIRDGRAGGCCRPLKRTIEIQEACRSTMKNAEIARMFGVDPSYISHLRAGRRGR
jgi:hypothetical protein